MSKRILITPLDWGLGHATRCIPIIKHFLNMGHEVFIAGNGASLTLLKKEFPSLKVFFLTGYDPQYSRSNKMVSAMLRQLPKFIETIKKEHLEVDKIISENKIDLIISDNRYGCWSRHVLSVFITHQSNIMMPKRFGFLSPLIRLVTERLINRFDVCWIPDYPGESGLAGKLISFGKIKYRGIVDLIGNISRFVPPPSAPVKKYDVVAVCSGPEPQRTLLEQTLLPQLQASGLKFLLVRGVFSNEPESDTLKNYLTTDDLRQVLLESDLVISRSGYSTLMDLRALGARAILIPTPGQTEQEYLAKRLTEQGIFYSAHQQEFVLLNAMEKARSFQGFAEDTLAELLTPAVERVMRMRRKTS